MAEGKYWVNLLKLNFRPGEVALWVRALAALPQDPGTVHCTKTTAHNCLQ